MFSPGRRTERLHVLLSAEEKAMLTELAARRGLTPSDQVRLMTREAHQALAGPGAEERGGKP